jgi:hypothetical protein
MVRTGCRYGLALATILGLAADAGAVVLSPAYSAVTFSTPGNGTTGTSVFGELSETDFGTADFGTYGFVDGTAMASTHFPKDRNDPPSVEARVETLATPGPSGLYPPPVLVTATAYMAYEAAVTPTIAPPFAVPSIPVTVVLNTELTRSSFNSTGGGYVYLGDDQLIAPLHDFAVSLGAEVDTAIFVQMSAYVETQASDLDPNAFGISSVVASMVDPVFSFDQETFDARYGPNSFPLEDYFEFQYSPNLIPEPHAAVLMMVVAWGLPRLARSRR